MLRYVYGHDETVAAFVAQLIPHVRALGFGPCRAIGVIDEQGQLIGGMVYSNWDPLSGIIEMSGAALEPRWLSRETLARVYRFPFLVCGCQMVIMRVRADDERLLRQLAAFGYVFIKVPRMFGRERDGVLALLTYEDWAANKFNRRYQHHLLPTEQIEGTIEQLELIDPTIDPMTQEAA